jgi:hypothetical protein
MNKLFDHKGKIFWRTFKRLKKKTSRVAKTRIDNFY